MANPLFLEVKWLWRLEPFYPAFPKAGESTGWLPLPVTRHLICSKLVCGEHHDWMEKALAE